VIRRHALKQTPIRLCRSGDSVMSSPFSGACVGLKASTFRIGGDVTVRSVKGLVTLSHNLWCCDYVSERNSIPQLGVAATSVARRRRALVRLRMA
jgi:hypothetical protein